MRIVTPREVFVVNERDQISRHHVPPSGDWLLVGAVEMRTVFGNWVQVRRFTVADIREGRVPWKHKNGKQRCYLLDRDHSTMRMWCSPTPYHTIA